MHNRNELHKLGQEFAAAYNARDMDRFDRLFHPDFRWHIAVTEYDDPQMRPLHSKLLAGRNLMWPKSIFDNLYCYVFEARDGQIVLFREYQDTLLLFDVWVAE